MTRLKWLIIILLSISHPLFAGKTAEGIVFEDRNDNGRMDQGEPGIANVMVSNQRDVVLTDNNGRFKLDLDGRTIIFISKPAGYSVPLNQFNLPQFYYRHFPAGSPDYLKYSGMAPTGKLPKKLLFPLRKSEVKNRFSVIVTGDPQPANNQHVDFFRDDAISAMLDEPAYFYFALGDIVWDDLSLYRRYNEAVSMLRMPAYNVHGNHDMNLRSPNDEFASETFRRWFGPEYFSFDYGAVHFIVLDDVGYQGWNSELNNRGHYTGQLSNKQLQWLKNDVALVPAEKLIVIASHIPIATALFPGEANNLTNRVELFKILRSRKKLLALSGHTHATEALKLEKSHGWTGNADFWAINPGAACGAWWSGPQDIRGIPEALCTDGSPNGYYLFEFDGTNYRYKFKPLNHPNKDQLRISSPRGSIQRSDSSRQQIIVNFFAGSKAASVDYSIDGNPAKQLRNKIGPDPFLAEYYNKNEASIASWIRNGNQSTHIWQADLPANLDPGMHKLHVTARDHQGNTFKKSLVFEIVEPDAKEEKQIKIR